MSQMINECIWSETDCIIEIQQCLLQLDSDCASVETLFESPLMERAEFVMTFAQLVLSVAGSKPHLCLLMARLCKLLWIKRTAVDIKVCLLAQVSEAQLLRPGAWFFFWNCIWEEFISVCEIVGELERFIVQKYKLLKGVERLNVISGVIWFVREIRDSKAKSILQLCDVIKDIVSPHLEELKQQQFLSGSFEFALKKDNVQFLYNQQGIPQRVSVTPFDFYMTPCCRPTPIQLAALYGSVDCFRYLFVNAPERNTTVGTSDDCMSWKPQQHNVYIVLDSSDDEAANTAMKSKLVKWWRKYQDDPMALVTLRDFSLAGGNNEIIRSLSDSGAGLMTSAHVAVMYHNNAAFDWIVKAITPTPAWIETIYDAALISDNFYVFKQLVGSYWSMTGMKRISKYRRLQMLKLASTTMSNEQIHVMIEAAITHNDVPGFKFLLHLNFTEFCMPLGTTGLLSAITNGSCGIVKEILKHDLLEISSMVAGSPLLTWAMRYDQFEIFMLLLNDKRIDPNVCKDKSPLHTAIQTGKIRCVEALLANPRVDVNQVCCLAKEPGTPLHFAIRSSELMFDLVNKHPKVDRNVSLPDGSNALHVALFQKKESIFYKLLKYPEVDVSKKMLSGWTILHAAVSSGVEKAVAYIVTHCLDKVDVNAPSDNGPALALAWESHDVLEELLKCEQLDVNVSIGGTSLFNWLVLHERSLWVPMLLHHKNFDCNYRGRDMKPALSVAVATGERKILSILVSEHNPDPNQQDKDGNTPMHIAAAKIDLELVQILLKCPNVDLAKQNQDLNTPLHLCAGGNSSLEMKFFNQYGYSADAWLRVFKKILDTNPAPINIQNSDGATPLHIAFTCHGRFNCTFLTVLNVDVRYDLCNSKGENLFHLAAMCGCVELIRAILKKYPQLLNSRTLTGETALHYAASRGKVDFISQLLLYDDIDRNPKNKAGKTPIDFAPPGMKAELSRYFPIEI